MSVKSLNVVLSRSGSGASTDSRQSSVDTTDACNVKDESQYTNSASNVRQKVKKSFVSIDSSKRKANQHLKLQEARDSACVKHSSPQTQVVLNPVETAERISNVAKVKAINQVGYNTVEDPHRCNTTIDYGESCIDVDRRVGSCLATNKKDSNADKSGPFSSVATENLNRFTGRQITDYKIDLITDDLILNKTVLSATDSVLGTIRLEQGMDENMSASDDIVSDIVPLAKICDSELLPHSKEVLSKEHGGTAAFLTQNLPNCVDSANEMSILKSGERFLVQGSQGKDIFVPEVSQTTDVSLSACSSNPCLSSPCPKSERRYSIQNSDKDEAVQDLVVKIFSEEGNPVPANDTAKKACVPDSERNAVVQYSITNTSVTSVRDETPVAKTEKDALVQDKEQNSPVHDKLKNKQVRNKDKDVTVHDFPKNAPVSETEKNLTPVRSRKKKSRRSNAASLDSIDAAGLSASQDVEVDDDRSERSDENVSDSSSRRRPREDHRRKQKAGRDRPLVALNKNIPVVLNDPS